MYRKFDGASGDAYVTVLTHDRVQLADGTCADAERAELAELS